MTDMRACNTALGCLTAPRPAALILTLHTTLA